MSFEIWLAVALTLLAVYIAWVLMPGGKSEAYTSLDHVFLNVRRPTTEWLNMGFWESPETQFPDAAEALARKVLSGVSQNHTDLDVLDVGHGCGDSLILIQDLLKPRNLDGVTSLSEQATRAKARTNGFANVTCGDACKFLQREDRLYSLIVAIDCAYHFPSRTEFFRLASSKLRKGGQIVLFDLAAAWPYPANAQQEGWAWAPSKLPAPAHEPSTRSKICHQIICRIASTPSANLVGVEQYVQLLKKNDFDDIAIEDISANVFPPFASFLKSLKRGAEQEWRGGSAAQIASLRGFASVVQGWAEGGDRGMVRGIIVSATK